MFAVQYATSKVPDPANGNILSWKVPQAAPTVGAGGKCDPLTANSGHPGAVLAAMGDGTVKSINPNVTMKTWNSALTPAGGEVLGDDW